MGRGCAWHEVRDGLRGESPYASRPRSPYTSADDLPSAHARDYQLTKLAYAGAMALRLRAVPRLESSYPQTAG